MDALTGTSKKKNYATIVVAISLAIVNAHQSWHLLQLKETAVVEFQLIMAIAISFKGPLTIANFS